MKKTLVASLRIIFPIAGIVSLTVGLFLFVSESFFIVTTIYIEADPAIFTDTHFLSGRYNLLLLSEKRLREQVQKSTPWAGEISIKRSYPNTLHIKITPREPLAYFTDSGRTYYVDKDGMVLPATPTKQPEKIAQLSCSLTQPVVGEFISEKHIRYGLSVIHLLRQERESVAKLSCAPDTSDVEIEVGGITVLSSPNQKPSVTVSSLQFLLKQFRIEGNRPKTIDLRFEKPVLIPERVTPAPSVTGTGESQDQNSPTPQE